MDAEALREQFVGKTVRLKSGGPLMTVDGVVETRTGLMLHCCWFDPLDSMMMERAQLTSDSVELDDGTLLPFLPN